VDVAAADDDDEGAPRGSAGVLVACSHVYMAICRRYFPPKAIRVPSARSTSFC
jgi:hypothetical protein